MLWSSIDVHYSEWKEKIYLLRVYVITGRGKIRARDGLVGAQDFTVAGGSFGEMDGKKGR